MAFHIGIVLVDIINLYMLRVLETKENEEGVCMPE